MTLKEAKRKIMIELDESGDMNALENIEDYETKLPDIINTIQKELAINCKPIEKLQYVVVKNGMYVKPKDCFLIKAFYKDNGNTQSFKLLADKILIADGKYQMLYEVIPANIDENTSDDYEFEIDIDCQEAMIHGICAQICINDEPELYQTYYERYNLAIANIIDKLNKSTKVTFTGGVDL